MAIKVRKMRVGIVAFSGIYPIHIGGPGNVAYFLAKEFGRMNCETTLFVRAKNRKEILAFKNMPEFNQLENVDVIPIMLDYRSRTLLNPFVILAKIVEASLKLHQEDFDIVFHNSPPIDIGVLFPLLCRVSNSKQVILIHGLFHSLGMLHRNPLGRFLIRIYRRLFDGIIVPGELPEGDRLPCGFKRDQVLVIPNGIPLEEIEEAHPIDLEGHPRIVHTGVLSRRKGIDTLMKAVSQLVEIYPDIRLYLVGDGPERENLADLSRLLGIENHVKFVGFVSDTRDVFRYYKSCDVFVMPSHKESFGITLAEAMACRTSIVASDIDGAPRMLVRNGINGFLFPAGDWKTLSRRLNELLADKALQERFAEFNYSMIREQFTWEIIASRYVSVFEDLLRAR